MTYIGCGKSDYGGSSVEELQGRVSDLKPMRAFSPVVVVGGLMGLFPHLAADPIPTGRMFTSGRAQRQFRLHRGKLSHAMPTCCANSPASADTRPASTPSCARIWRRTAWNKSRSQAGDSFAIHFPGAAGADSLSVTILLVRTWTVSSTARCGNSQALRASWIASRLYFVLQRSAHSAY